MPSSAALLHCPSPPYDSHRDPLCLCYAISLFQNMAHANPRLEHSLPDYAQSPGLSIVLISRKPPLRLTLAAGVFVHHRYLCSRV